MTKLRLLICLPLLAASGSFGCAQPDEDADLDVAAVDRGAVAMYAPGPAGGDDLSLPDGMGDLILRTSYDEGANRGHTHFRIYTRDGGVWTEVHLQTLCTDGNWVEHRQEDFVSPHYWMFADVDCPSPYSVSEAWASVALDY